MKINYDQILDIFILDIIPRITKNVENGNKIFAGAILKKDDLSIVTIGLNNEIKNPLLHGEISTIINFFENNKAKDLKKYIFISTHEPCSLCLSAITWAGFDNFYYFFPYSETKDKFSIPHDLNILSEVFKIEKGHYNSPNKYWHSYSIIKEISKILDNKREKLYLKIDKIKNEFDILSSKYQENKHQNQIPFN